MKFLLLFFLLISFEVNSQDIHQLVKEGTVVEIEQHISKIPSSINKVSSSGYTPLMLAAYHNKVEVVKILLEKGVAINTTSAYGTALMAAVVKGNTTIVDLLIAHKADVNLTDENGSTALLLAALFNQTKIAQQLLVAGAYPHHKDYRGNKALDYAILKQNESLITLLNQYL